MQGTGKNHLAEELGQNYNWHHICTRSLLQEEQVRGTDDGKRIEECMANGRQCEDSVVIRLVKEEIAKCEEKSQSWIVSGFPQTKVQALSLQRLKIVPDKFICVNRQRSDLNAQEFDDWKCQFEPVRSSFDQFIYDYDVSGEPSRDVQNLGGMLELRFVSGASRRPPRVVLIGPPGSGRST